MHERRKFWELRTAVKLFKVLLSIISICTLIGCWVSIHIVSQLQSSLLLGVQFLIAQFVFAIAIFTALGAIVLLIHRSLGPLPRLEDILEQIRNGNYSLRMRIRKKDFLVSFVEKLNAVLDILEEKAKK